MEITIVYSRKESMKNGAERIRDFLVSKGVKAEYFAIQDLKFFNFKPLGKFPLSNYIYFLTNDRSVEILTRIFDVRGQKVLNADNFKNRYSKAAIQLILSQNGFQTPANYYSPESQLNEATFKGKLKFPIIMKSFRHMEKRQVVRGPKIEINKLKSNHVEPVYLEHFYEDASLFKAYVIDGKVFYNQDVPAKIPASLGKKFLAIGVLFNLEVYTVDCLWSSPRDCPIIDVNPSPAFMGSDAALASFCKYIQNLPKKI